MLFHHVIAEAKRKWKLHFIPELVTEVRRSHALYKFIGQKTTALSAPVRLRCPQYVHQCLIILAFPNVHEATTNSSFPRVSISDLPPPPPPPGDDDDVGPL
eukprot:8378396-Karenia_brevis.AAC.1